MKNHLLPEKAFYKKLCEVNALKSLNADVMDLIVSHSHQHHFEQQAYLIRYSSTDKNVFFLLSGRLRATITSSKGREIGYKEIHQGDMFGELSAIDGQPRSISVVAIEPSHVAIIKQDDFLMLLKNETEFSMVVMQHLTHMIRELSEKVFEFGTMNIQERVYIELLRMAQPYINDSLEVEIHPVPTHTQIANMIAANREAVTREMNNLKIAGLIKLKKGRTLVIKNIKDLEKIVGDIVDR